MAETITLDLPESLVESARAVAARSHRRVEDVLIEWLDRAAMDVPVELLSDDGQPLAASSLLEASTHRLLGRSGNQRSHKQLVVGVRPLIPSESGAPNKRIEPAPQDAQSS